MLINEADIFVTETGFDQVVKDLQQARDCDHEPKHRDGDEWKDKGYDDHED